MIRLEELRVNAGMSRQQLGELAGVSGMTIRRIEKGQVRPQASTLKAIADAIPGEVYPVELLQVTDRAAAA